MTADALAGLPLFDDEARSLFAPLARENSLLVAVSGGPDSVALLALLAAWAGCIPSPPRLFSATVDHGLRPEAAAEARQVEVLSRRLGIPHETLVWQGEKPENALQERAREARYALLRAHAEALGACIVTAHTLDDQAETLLMRMAKGSGPAGLAGMRARIAHGGIGLARPLLGIAKSRLVATCRARALAFVDDPSNLDPRFDRVRWRRLLPELAHQGLTARRLGTLAGRLVRAEEALSARAAELLPSLLRPGPPVGLDLAPLARQPMEIALRVLAGGLLEAGAAEGAIRLERLEACGEALIAAAAAGEAQRRTLAGFTLSLGRDGILTLAPERVRKRGVHLAAE